MPPAASARMAGAFLWIAVGGLAVTACAPTSGQTWLPPAPPEVTVQMRDHAFEFETPIPAGRVVFRIRNAGRVAHRLALVPLPPDFPPLEVELRTPRARYVQQLITIPNTGPGGKASFAVDLTAGRYAFICFAVDADGMLHALKGMASEFKVR